MHGTAPASFGQWLKQRRKALDLTQEDLADRIGCSDVTIRKIESGVRRPSRQIAELLVDCLKIQPEEQEAFVSFARTGSLAGASLSLTPQSQDADAGSSAQPVPNNLPTLVNALIGREEEIASAADLIGQERVRLLTLTGPPGIGKTSLSIHLAKGLLGDFPGGIFFVQLAPVTDPGLVVDTIARTLGVMETGDELLLVSLQHFLQDKKILLVLDNFEQVVEAAPLVAQLVAVAPGLKVLVTSRRRLQVRGEKEFGVSPLGLPRRKPPPTAEQLTQYDAVCLFVERATDVKADFAVTNENAPAVAEICHRLDGLPLAIELAAARIKILTPQAMLARLENRLKVVTGGGRDLSARQQTLRGAIEWSYDLLLEDEK